MTDMAEARDLPIPDDDPTSTVTDAPTSSEDEATKWKALARKHEKQAKTTAAELERLRREQMTEADQAQATARDAGFTEGIAAGAQKVAAAEIKAALTGVVPNPGSIVEDLTLTKFLTDDYEVDADKVASLVEKYRGLVPANAETATPPPPAPHLRPAAPPTGTGGGQSLEDRARARFERMNPRKPAA